MTLNNFKNLSALAVAVSLLSTTATATAEPRKIRVHTNGSTQDVDYRTNRIIKTRVRGGEKGGGKGQDEGRGRDGPYNDKLVDISTIEGSTGDSGPTNSRSGDLPPLDLSDMRLWNWNGLWHASEWDNVFSDIPWRFDHVIQTAGGDTMFVLDAVGAPELKAQKQAYQKRGYWEVDVTLPSSQSGLVIAPLWLWNDDTKDEIDFEFAGTKGLQLTIHSYGSGRHVQSHVIVPNTDRLTGQRVRFGIRTDIDSGKIDMSINGELVHTFNRSDNPAAFPKSGLKPIISMWPAKAGLVWAEQWLGRFAGHPATMVVHGYNFTE